MLRARMDVERIAKLVEAQGGFRTFDASMRRLQRLAERVEGYARKLDMEMEMEMEKEKYKC